LLIIGCGNLQRGDDAAGIMAARKLRALGIDARVCAGEASELLDTWSGADDVLVIDAVITGAPVGTVHRWNNPDSITFGKSAGSTHGFGLAEAVGLARAMRRFPSRLRIYGIEGQNFEMGATVSAEVQGAVEEVVNELRTK
jgi:hydrogenase maturation protease